MSGNILALKSHSVIYLKFECFSDRKIITEIVVDSLSIENEKFLESASQECQDTNISFCNMFVWESIKPNTLNVSIHSNIINILYYLIQDLFLLQFFSHKLAVQTNSKSIREI